MKKAILTSLASQAGSFVVFAIACFTKWSTDFGTWPPEDRWITAAIALIAAILAGFLTWTSIDFKEKYPNG